MDEGMRELTQILAQKQGEINRLNEELDDKESILRGNAWGWTIPGELTDDENLSLPMPRMEVRWTPLDDENCNWQCDYRLVYRHFLGHIAYTMMGRTTSRGASRSPVTDGYVGMPFRDGAHIRSDAAQFGLPAYAICGETITKLDLDAGKSSSST